MADIEATTVSSTSLAIANDLQGYDNLGSTLTVCIHESDLLLDGRLTALRIVCEILCHG
jgi:hypothetical protein